MKTLLSLTLLVAIGTAPAAARSHRFGATTFRTSQCKSARCFARHPNGTYVHPPES